MRKNEHLLDTYGRHFRPWPESQSLIPNGISTEEQSLFQYNEMESESTKQLFRILKGLD